MEIGDVYKSLAEKYGQVIKDANNSFEESNKALEDTKNELMKDNVGESDDSINNKGDTLFNIKSLQENLADQIKKGDARISVHQRIVLNPKLFRDDNRKRAFASAFRSYFGLNDREYQQLLQNIGQNTTSVVIFDGNDASKVYSFQEWLLEWEEIQITRVIKFIPNEIPEDKKENIATLIDNCFDVNYNQVLTELKKDSNQESIITAIEIAKELGSSYSKEKKNVFLNSLKNFELTGKISVQEAIIEENEQFLNISESERDMILDDIKQVLPNEQYNVNYLPDDNLIIKNMDRDFLLRIGIKYGLEYIETYDDGEGGIYHRFKATYGDDGEPYVDYGRCRSIVLREIRAGRVIVSNKDLDIEYDTKLKNLVNGGIEWVANVLANRAINEVNGAVNDGSSRYPLNDYLSTSSTIQDNSAKDSLDLVNAMIQRMNKAKCENIVNKIAKEYREKYSNKKNEVVEELVETVKDTANKHGINFSEEAINKIRESFKSQYVSDDTFESHVKDLLNESGIGELYEFIEIDGGATGANLEGPDMMLSASSSAEFRSTGNTGLNLTAGEDAREQKAEQAFRLSVGPLEDEIKTFRSANDVYIDNFKKELDKKFGMEKKPTEYTFNPEDYDLKKVIESGDLLRNRDITKTHSWELEAQKAGINLAFGAAGVYAQKFLNDQVNPYLKNMFGDMGLGDEGIMLSNSIANTISNALSRGIASTFDSWKNKTLGSLEFNDKATAQDKADTQKIISDKMDETEKALNEKIKGEALKSEKKQTSKLTQSWINIRNQAYALAADIGGQYAEAYARKLFNDTIDKMNYFGDSFAGEVGNSFAQALTRQVRNWVGDNLKRCVTTWLENGLLGKNGEIKWEGLNIDWTLVGAETLAGVLGSQEVAEVVNAGARAAKTLKNLIMNFEEFAELDYMFLATGRFGPTRNDSFEILCNRCCNRWYWNRRNKYKYSIFAIMGFYIFL